LPYPSFGSLVIVVRRARRLHHVLGGVALAALLGLPGCRTASAPVVTRTVTRAPIAAPAVAPAPALPHLPDVAAAAKQTWGQVRGWNILSNSAADARVVIARAPAYGINQLQLSHQVVHDLRQVRVPARRALVNDLVGQAHAAGIGEVLLWDHALYSLSHYPEQFRTGPGKTLDLDNPAFWTWFKQDYREMLDLVPGINGLVVTFIETGARAERQFSQKLTTPAAKLAAVINAVADVVVGERKLQMYARSFAYTKEEYTLTLAALALVARPEVRLMMKETPHDFFLTHPVDPWVGSIARPTIIEFDAGNEFSGQGQIATTWPEVMLKRWGLLQQRPHVIGYVARTDRFGASRIVGHPAEILLYALARKTADPKVTADDVYRDFVTGRYGAPAVPHVVAALSAAHDIVTSALYTLGTSTASHSTMAYDPYASNWGRHVSGKWIEPPVVHVGHGIDKDLHYWRDVVEPLAPAKLKRADGPLAREAPWVLSEHWVTAEERMTEPVLDLVVREKKFGVDRAVAALSELTQAASVLEPADRAELVALFRRTWLTARLHAGVAAAYFGYRVWARGAEFRTDTLEHTIRDGLFEIEAASQEILDEPSRTPEGGEWKWRGDAKRAREYLRKITDGWPEYGGAPFPYGAVVPQAVGG
jgi:hypothetical protein